MGYNTILIESGHFFNDYQREKTREFTFYALLQGIYSVVNRQENIDYKSYFKIPNNKKRYLDIIVKSITSKGGKVDIDILFIEKLINNELRFIPTIDKIENLSNYNANKIVEKPDLFFLSKQAMNVWVKNMYN